MVCWDFEHKQIQESEESFVKQSIFLKNFKHILNIFVGTTEIQNVVITKQMFIECWLSVRILSSAFPWQSVSQSVAQLCPILCNPMDCGTTALILLTTHWGCYSHFTAKETKVQSREVIAKVWELGPRRWAWCLKV